MAITKCEVSDASIVLVTVVSGDRHVVGEMTRVSSGRPDERGEAVDRSHLALRQLGLLGGRDRLPLRHETRQDELGIVLLTLAMIWPGARSNKGIDWT